MKALIVDDNIINLKVAQKLLEHENIMVDTVKSGFECLDKIQKTNYDVIFMDIMMPEMDGVETFEKLKKVVGFQTPVIVLTADAEAGAKEKYLKLGFFEYISKPINIKELQNIIKKL